jgi:hypothetical protein
MEHWGDRQGAIVVLRQVWSEWMSLLVSPALVSIAELCLDGVASMLDRSLLSLTLRLIAALDPTFLHVPGNLRVPSFLFTDDPNVPSVSVQQSSSSS